MFFAFLCGLFFGWLGYGAWQEEKDRKDGEVMKAAVQKWLEGCEDLPFSDPPLACECEDGCLRRTSYVDGDGNVHHYATSSTTDAKEFDLHRAITTGFYDASCSECGRRHYG